MPKVYAMGEGVAIRKSTEWYVQSVGGFDGAGRTA